MHLHEKAGTALFGETEGGRDGDHARDPPVPPVSVFREPPLRRMALDQPGVGVSSAYAKSIARVIRTPPVRTASAPGRREEAT
jgi:hypothetical protein